MTRSILMRLAAVAAAATLMSACSDSHAQHAGADTAPAVQAAGGAGVASNYSVYDLDAAAWTDQAGTRRKLGSLAGRVQVVSMVYTSCSYACPRIVGEMKRIEAELADAAGDVGFVMVSIDPDRDTPAAIAEYAATTHLALPSWTILTGTADGVLELASVLNVRYRRLDDGEFEHANVLTVLDRDGRVLHRQDGIGEGRDGTVAAIRAALDASPVGAHAMHQP